ncbi:bladder cancer-associated protein isoform X4 [Oncorhynchus tshawytscha]|uniref:bladder cancer-associated protein isoform X4 n=2 Tax=Oncorhynchus tshawytscha TaxID=74940 RepID=UPI000D0A22D2|nr:bladder cancer-associated protein isoform X4 [Oncorhynchus tshawytscha]
MASERSVLFFSQKFIFYEQRLSLLEVWMYGPMGLPRVPGMVGGQSEVVKPDQNTFEDHLQARDVEIFDQVRLYMDKAQEKQKESHQMRIKGTKCFDIRANDLAWKKDKRKARPGKPCCSFASGWGPHLLRTASAKAAEALTNEDTLVALEMAEGSGKSATSVKTSCFVIFILLHITNM